MSGRIRGLRRYTYDADSKCIRCGCTDSRACFGGCSWAAIDESRKLGICTSCMRGETLEQLDKALAAEVARG